MAKNVFEGRSFCVSSDLSLDEKVYLFNKIKELKQAIIRKDSSVIDSFRINNSDFGVYTVFLEDSTRTLESFNNALAFHNVKSSNFNASSSSFNKKESYADGFMTLAGYDNRIFIVRSKLEGVCRYLENEGRAYAARNNLPFASAFINAGDGMHEHPTQESLDEFSLLEDNSWNRDSLHIALVGDLFHGRTVHSKAEGLKFFKNVKVDLVAPDVLQMPQHYIDIMRNNNFDVSIFGSLEEYFDSKNVASQLYFTRPQLERMGEDVLSKQQELRKAITLTSDLLKKISNLDDLKVYHPLPRHKEHPVIPTYLDNLPLNRWESQSINGLYSRIVLLAAIAGKIGSDFEGTPFIRPTYSDKGIITYADLSKRVTTKTVLKDGINPLVNGVVIDRFCRGESKEVIWNYMYKTMNLLGLDSNKGFIGVGESKSDPGIYKGLLFLPNSEPFLEDDLKRLAAISGGCVVNNIVNKNVFEKIHLSAPSRVYGLDDLVCKNTSCISSDNHAEMNAVPEFIALPGGDSYSCAFCDTAHTFKELWK